MTGALVWGHHPAGACCAAAEAAALRYNWSNICMHYFSREFLEQAAQRLAAEGRHHIARKKIPSKDGPVEVRSLGTDRSECTQQAPLCMQACQRDRALYGGPSPNGTIRRSGVIVLSCLRACGCACDTLAASLLQDTCGLAPQMIQ